MDLHDQKVIVVGLGKSGVAAARLCRDAGASVTGNDSVHAEQLSAEAAGLGIELVTGGHDEVDFEHADLVVVSPGVPRLPQLQRAAAAGVEVIGELELAWRALPEREQRRLTTYAIGGTNGKSTTTRLVELICAAAGRRSFAGGNLGTPLSEVVADALADGDGTLPYDDLVLETSSFQLERVPTFHPDVAVLLNISEDHLDRYDGFADYARAKGNAFVQQTADDVAVIPAGDAGCAEQAARGTARVVTFGADAGDYQLRGRRIAGPDGFSADASASELHGMHNLLNAAAAAAATGARGCSGDAVTLGLGHFVPLPHRMAKVASVDGVTYYDDSKATNVGAAVTALSGLMEPKGVLIAGGRDKGGSYEPLARALATKGRALVLIGEAAERIARAVGDSVRVERASSMEAAVRAAAALAEPGDAVLLSPACSSFDMFASYGDRGEHFARAVAQLLKEAST